MEELAGIAIIAIYLDDLASCTTLDAKNSSWLTVELADFDLRLVLKRNLSEVWLRLSEEIEVMTHVRLRRS